jgi:hypothetical protein
MNKFVSFAKVALLFAGCAFVVTSCTEEDEDPSIIGSWVFTDAVFNPAVMIDSVMVTDAYSMFFPTACSQDDIVIFQDGGVQVNDQGSLKCDSTAAQQETSSYSYTGSTLYMISADGDTTSYMTDIVISASTITGSTLVDVGSGDVNVDFTLTRQ